MTMKSGSTRMLVFAFAMAGLSAVPASAAGSKAVVTEQDKADMAYIAKLPHNGSTVELDISDPIQYRYFLRQQELAGVDLKKDARMSRMVEDLRQEHVLRNKKLNIKGASNLKVATAPVSNDTQPIVPLNFLTAFGPGEAPGTFSVTAYTSVPGTLQTDGMVTQSTVGLYDANGTPLGPPNSIQQMSNGAIMRNTTQAPVPATGDIIAQGSYLYQTSSGKHIGALYLRSSPAAGGSYTMQNFKPIDVNGNGTIKVCIYRRDTDCDYWANSESGKMVVKFPIKDTFTIPEPLQPIAVQRQKGFVSVTVSQPEANNGGGCTLPANFDFWNYVTITGSSMSWDIDPGPFSNPTGSSIPCFPANTNVVYDLQILAIGNSNGTETYRFGEVKTTTNPPPPPIIGSVNLVPMVVAYGCLAEGSRVLMSDGSSRPIEDVKLGDKVWTATAAGWMTVIKRTNGVEQIPMVRISVGSGDDLLLTETHPVLTDQGPKMARNLAAGMQVRTVNGLKKIVRLMREKFDGRIWNLDLGDGSGHQLPPTAQTTFVANGFVVGDGQMQKHIEDESKLRIAQSR